MKTNLTPFEEELRDLEDRHLYRRCKNLKFIGPTRAQYDGKEILLFCSNDYLGLAHDPRIAEAAARAARDSGFGAGAARLISGTCTFHTDLEAALARMKGKERAVLYTTGYLANLGILTALAGENDLIVADKLSHASIIDGARLSGATVRSYPHKNYRRLRGILDGARSFRRRLVVSDTVFSMDGDLADFEELAAIKKHYEALLILDDAHGTGVLGRSGAGALEGSGFEADVDVLMGTLSKAVGTLGGFAACSSVLAEVLVNRSRPFIFATALPPPVCAAALEGLRLIREDESLRKKIWENIERMHRNLSGLGFELPPPVSPIFPVIVGAEAKAVRLSDALLKTGILIPAVRTPTVPRGRARLRVTVSAAHSSGEIDHLSECLKKLI